jgi:transketolase
MINKKTANKLNQISFYLKKKILEISFKKKSHHIGSCLSCIDILVSLYFSIMRINLKNKTNNDLFIMSKGHAALAYYLVLMKKKFFSENYLFKNFLSNNGRLGGHPDRNEKLGINYCSGSLGQGISVGCGLALNYYKKRIKKNVFVLIGDGECNEGMVWESMLFAAHHKLNNLYTIIDYNKLQGLGSTTSILNLESLKNKIQSFNWNVVECDGHNIEKIIKSFKKLKSSNKNKPNLLIAHTIKGKGVSFMENKFESHYEVLDTKSFLMSINDKKLSKKN